ncbi:MAG TPA: hypothetical protein VEJ89_02485 [Myxococcaceae bacterium]|nr:hypothetical protein [Myxococcaceae bacterium]
MRSMSAAPPRVAPTTRTIRRIPAWTSSAAPRRITGCAAAVMQPRLDTSEMTSKPGVSLGMARWR